MIGNKFIHPLEKGKKNVVGGNNRLTDVGCRLYVLKVQLVIAFLMDFTGNEHSSTNHQIFHYKEVTIMSVLLMIELRTFFSLSIR